MKDNEKTLILEKNGNIKASDGELQDLHNKLALKGEQIKMLYSKVILGWPNKSFLSFVKSELEKEEVQFKELLQKTIDKAY